jgi:hypothetical protein
VILLGVIAVAFLIFMLRSCHCCCPYCGWPLCCSGVSAVAGIPGSYYSTPVVAGVPYVAGLPANVAIPAVAIPAVAVIHAVYGVPDVAGVHVVAGVTDVAIVPPVLLSQLLMLS